MADRHFPVRPNLEQLRHQAKDLLRAIKRGDPSAARELRRHHPEEWLLRWNLLESLIKVDRAPDLRRQIRDELLEIEKSDPHELPISTGLDYLQVL